LSVAREGLLPARVGARAVFVERRGDAARREEFESPPGDVGRANRFTRSEPRESVSRRQTATPVEERLDLTRRVTREKRRVESPPRGGSTVVRQQATARSENFAHAGDAADGPGPPRAPSAASAHAAPPFAAGPAVNLQQLTDEVIRQIDSRIVAHKERMGKLF
jgi:hypothetical protein